MCGLFLLSYAASWTRPASVPSGAGAHVGISWTRPASVPPGAGARPGRPLRPAWHGTGGKVLPARGTR